MLSLVSPPAVGQIVALVSIKIVVIQKIKWLIQYLLAKNFSYNPKYVSVLTHNGLTKQ